MCQQKTLGILFYLNDTVKTTVADLLRLNFPVKYQEIGKRKLVLFDI